MYTVGRDPDCDIAIVDQSISRRHAKMYVEQDSIRVVDLESKNGTYVNGKRLAESAAVRSGDLLCFGSVLSSIRGAPALPPSLHTASSGDLLSPRTALDGETCSLNSIDLNQAYRKSNRTLLRLLESFGGIAEILRTDLASPQTSEKFLDTICAITRAARVSILEAVPATDQGVNFVVRNGLAESDLCNKPYVLSAIERAYRNQEIVWSRDADASRNDNAANRNETSMAVPLTCTGRKLGVLLLGDLAVDPESSRFDLELCLLAADILAAKLLNIKTSEVELAKAANEARLQEVEANRQALTKAYRILLEQQEDLLQAKKLTSLGRLAAGVTHELNTPLSVITASCYTISTALERMNLTQAEPRLVDAIKASTASALAGAKRISETVSALGILAHDGKPEIGEVNLAENIAAVIHLLRSHFAPSVGVKIEVPRELRLICAGRELNSILLAILENSFQAVSQAGEITVSAVADTQQVQISIVDDGCGIAPEVMASLFDPDFVVRDGHVRLGLGLCLVRRLLVAMGGSISIASEPLAGTQIRISLPLSVEGS